MYVRRFRHWGLKKIKRAIEATKKPQNEEAGHSSSSIVINGISTSRDRIDSLKKHKVSGDSCREG